MSHATPQPVSRATELRRMLDANAPGMPVADYTTLPMVAVNRMYDYLDRSEAAVEALAGLLDAVRHYSEPNTALGFAEEAAESALARLTEGSAP